MIDFPTDISSILKRIESIKPIKYGETRNYIDGDITYISPYISRGVISTKMVMNSLLKRGYEFNKIEKLIQELAWRDYFQQNWIVLQGKINKEIKNKQEPVDNYEIPTSIINAKTGIQAIDEHIKEFYKTGYLHNHVRMYIASITCNIANCHWKLPSKWMYYHLLDGDWGTNAACWQWVSGANSTKKYLANQENINKYCKTEQKDSFLSVSYEALPFIKKPDVLSEVSKPNLETILPYATPIKINTSIPTVLYTSYNLDPQWQNKAKANRILVLEPSVFTAYPVSQKSIHFILELATNIPDIQIYVGEFKDLYSSINQQKIYYKEHPLTNHFVGIEEERDWMFSVTGYHHSFFSFWKKCKKEALNG